MSTQTTLRSVEEHAKERRQSSASFREVEELDHEKLKVAKVIIGERIRRRLTQAKLAKRLGVTQQQISKLENGAFDHLATIQHVLAMLGYHVRVSAVPLHHTVRKQLHRSQI